MTAPWIPVASLSAVPVALVATLGLAVSLPGMADAQGAAAATPADQTAATAENDPNGSDEAEGADATAGLAADEDPARGEPEPTEADDQTPVVLAPVDAWQEDPTVVFSTAEVDLNDFMWVARPVVVFADTPADPAFQEQMEYLADRVDALAERDVVMMIDTDPEAMSELRRRLRPRGFMLAVLGKDGGVKLRKPFPWDVRELTRSIDKMPLRQQEIRDQNL